MAYLFGETRDVGDLWIGGRGYVATGGMSSGDEPTDAFGWVCIYAETGVSAEPIRVGAAAERPLQVRFGGGGVDIVVTLGPVRTGTPGAHEGGTVESALHEPGELPELKAAIDTLEALVLARAVAGIDVASAAYAEGLDTVIDAIGSQVEG